MTSYNVPNPRERTTLHRVKVHMVMALAGNFIMINLQNAKESVNQIETVWIMIVKFVWNSRNIPQLKEYFSSGGLAWESIRYICEVKGMFSTRTMQSAKAMAVRIRLIGLERMSLCKRTIMFKVLEIEPKQQTVMASTPCIGRYPSWNS